MTDSTQTLIGLTVFIAIRENIKHPDIKAIKYYINKNFATDLEKKPFDYVVMKLLDHNITENRPTPK